MRKKLFIILFITILSFWAVKPLFAPGFFPIHDDAQVTRVYEIGKSLQGGMFPVRYVADLGFNYGYPIFNFYAPFAYYVGAIIHFLSGVDVLVATKIMMGFAIVFSGISMFLLASEIFGIAGGFISALLYMYAPYHALDVYVRGDIPEVWAYGFIPLVFWGFYKINSKVKTQKSKVTRNVFMWIGVAAFSYAGVIVSHNLIAMMFTPFLLLYIISCIFLAKNHKLQAASYLLSAFILGVFISASYWLPVFPELKYTNVLSQVGGGFNFHDNFICLQQLWYSPWGYGGSAKGCIDGISFMLGKIHLLFVVIAFFAALLTIRKEKVSKIILSSIVLGGCSLLLTLQVTQPIWELIKPMAFFQFPWRFLLMVYFFFSFAGGGVFFYLRRLPKIFFIIGVVIASFLIIVMNQKFFVVKQILDRSSDYYTSKQIIEWDISKASYEYMPKDFKGQKSKVKTFFVADTNTQLKNIKDTVIEKSADVVLPKDGIVHANLAYFPTWHVSVDGKEISPQITPTGLDIPLSQGSHVLIIYYQETMIERVADMVSIIGIIAAIVAIMYQGRFTIHEKEKR